MYTHENIAMVGSARNVLESAGIDCRLQNQYAGGGSGELPYVQAWPELWVIEDADYQRACQLLEKVFDAPAGADWQCEHCAENNASSFEVCWHCGAGRGGQ